MGAIAVAIQKAADEAAAVIGPVGQTRKPGILRLGNMRLKRRPIRIDVPGPDDAAVTLRAGRSRAAQNNRAALRFNAAAIIKISPVIQQGKGVVDVGAFAFVIDRLLGLALGFDQVKPPGVNSLLGKRFELRREPCLHVRMREVHQVAIVISRCQSFPAAIGGEETLAQGIGIVFRILSDHRPFGRKHDSGSSGMEAGNPLLRRSTAQEILAPLEIHLHLGPVRVNHQNIQRQSP
jgi:hypothetical protein